MQSLLILLLAGCIVTSRTVLLPTASALPILNTSTLSATNFIAPENSTTPTLLPRITTVEAAIESCDGSREWGRDKSISPNGDWVVVLCNDDGVYTKVARSDGTRTWKLPATTFVDQFGVVYNPVYYRFYRWSINDNYLYLSKYSCCIDSPELVFVEAFGLYRLNLVNGQIDTIYTGHHFSLSPTERYFVSVEMSRTILIRDSLTGQQYVISLKPKYTDVGDFKWSSDETKLLFVAGVDGWIDLSQGFSLFLYDLRLRSLNLLIDNDIRQFIPADYHFANVWLDDEAVILAEPYSDSFWKINISTKELSPYNGPTPPSTP